MTQQQRKAAHGSSFPCWRYSLEGDIRGTLKRKGVWILWHRESPQLSMSLGILVRFGFLLDLKSFFASCDGQLGYQYREPDNYNLKLQGPKWRQVPVHRKPVRSFLLCLCGLSPNISWIEPDCAGLGHIKCSMPIYWCALLICSVA